MSGTQEIVEVYISPNSDHVIELVKMQAKDRTAFLVQFTGGDCVWRVRSFRVGIAARAEYEWLKNEAMLRDGTTNDDPSRARAAAADESEDLNGCPNPED